MRKLLENFGTRKEVAKFCYNLEILKEQSTKIIIRRDKMKPKGCCELIRDGYRRSSEEFSANEFLKLNDKKSIRQFFEKRKPTIGIEYEFEELSEQLVAISPESLSLKMCLAVYSRSLTLVLQYLIAKENTSFEKSNKTLTERAMEILWDHPLPKDLYPRLGDEPITDYGFINTSIASSTAMCCSKQTVFIGYPGRIYTIEKFSDDKTPKLLFEQETLQNYSLVCVNEVLLIATETGIMSLKDGELVPVQIKNAPFRVTSTRLLPVISDGHFVYSIDDDLTVRIFEVIDSALVYTRRVKMKKPPYLTQYQNMLDISIVSNGSELSFVWKEDKNIICSIFSLITGQFIDTVRIADVVGYLYSWCYDSDLTAIWMLSDDGLGLYHSYAAVPYWKLGIPLVTPEIGRSVRRYFINNLLLWSMHFVGGMTDVSMSRADPSSAEALNGVIASIASQDPDIVSMHTYLALLQVKMRKFAGNDVKTLATSLLKIIRNPAWESAGSHVVFVFMSNITQFVPLWNESMSELLTLIISKHVNDSLLWSFLPFDFPIEKMNVEVISSLTNLALTPTADRRKAPLLLDQLQYSLVQKIDSPQIRMILSEYMKLIMIQFIGNWTACLESCENITEFVSFQTLESLLVMLFGCLEKVRLPLSTINQCTAVTILQQIAPQIDERCQILFDRVFYISLHAIIEEILNEPFIDFGYKNTTVIDDEDEHKVLISLVDGSCCSDENSRQQFLDKMSGKFSLEYLKECAIKINQIAPQPLRKIERYLESGNFSSIRASRSAMYHFLDMIQCVSQLQKSSVKLTYIMFQEKLLMIRDDFMALPKDRLATFIEKTSFSSTNTLFINK